MEDVARTRDDDDVRTAQQLLWGRDIKLEEMIALYRRLAAARRFDLARRVAGLALNDPRLTDPKLVERVSIRYAFYNFKDESLPIKYRLGRALGVLNARFDLSRTDNQEVIGLAGAIFKRMWETSGRMLHLHRAIAYYRRGVDLGLKKDQGYNAINIAFLLDVLAEQEETEARSAGTVSGTAAARREEARRIRETIVETLPALAEEPGFDWLGRQFWFYATVAEAYFGLGRYDEAETWLGKAMEWNPSEEEIQINARQLATIARLNGVLSDDAADSDNNRAFKAIGRLVGEYISVGDFTGKIGLALSGGGFRASLYHIGVLAKLAELDVLRRVEVLSCVSGGSIIGAHYYLKVKRLLESKSDYEITREDYIEIVAQIAQEFLAGVQQNIRTRVFAGYYAGLKMAFLPRYSSTLRLGELFESELFARVGDMDGKRPRWMDELGIRPLGEGPAFIPEQSNWRRRAKVPELILNATSLNTGHNWQFTARGMGESAWSVRAENNEGTLYRFASYQASAAPGARIRLGQAVAASACVPGLFGPITLRNLYGEGTVVRLVDGGVYDNQGVVGLLDRGCSWFLISDASGQFIRTNSPAGGLLGGAMRSSEIQSRIVRDTLFEGLGERRGFNLSGGYMFVHLRKDLDDLDETTVSPEVRRVPLTAYGVPKEVQARLSMARTDLDSFSDVEAYALMTSGYRMTDLEFQHGNVPAARDASRARHGWKFLAIEAAFNPPDRSNRLYSQLLRLLSVSRLRLGKPFKLLLPLRLSLYLLLTIVCFGFLYKAWVYADVLLKEGITISVYNLWILIFIFFAVVIKKLDRSGDVEQVAIGFFLSAGGWLLLWLHLLVFDRLYLRFGSIERFMSGGKWRAHADAPAASHDSPLSEN